LRGLHRIGKEKGERPALVNAGITSLTQLSTSSPLAPDPTRFFILFSSFSLAERRAWWTVRWPDSHPAQASQHLATPRQDVNETTTSKQMGRGEFKLRHIKFDVCWNFPLGKPFFFCLFV